MDPREPAERGTYTVDVARLLAARSTSSPTAAVYDALSFHVIDPGGGRLGEGASPASCAGGAAAARLDAQTVDRQPVDVFALFRDSALRRDALHEPVGSPERYCLYGLDELVAQGFTVEHNLERALPAWAPAANRVANRAVGVLGAAGGDFARVLPSLRRLNSADVVYSTVDTVGLPLVLLGRASLVRRPVVYTAIGLPERLERLRGDRARSLYRGALCQAREILAFSRFEAEALADWLGRPVTFVPFAVDSAYFRPLPERTADVDVVTIGADPHRDLELFRGLAERNPALRFRAVATRDYAQALASPPPNVEVELDVPFSDVLDRLASARVVALPVKENSYSGATTVLLQALATARPVVVSRTKAIETGYDLEDGENCRLIPPGDADAFAHALDGLLGDEHAAQVMGAKARSTAEAFSWGRFGDALERILRAAA